MLGLSFSGPDRTRTETEVRADTAPAPVTAAPQEPGQGGGGVPATPAQGTSPTAEALAWPTAPAANLIPAADPVPAVPADPAAPADDAAADHTVAPAHLALPMQVLVFTSQKGGSGKTTLCGHLAVAAELSGHGPVAMVDCDPQGSLADWWNARAAHTPLFVSTNVAKLGDTLKMLKMQGITLVFIDTPPSVTNTIRDIVGHADLVVIPTRPSPHDLRAVGATLDIVDTQGKPLVFAVNGATKRAKITGDTAIALSQHGTVAPVTLHHRNDFATSMIDGGTVMEANPSSNSAAEVVELWRYLHSRLRKERRPGPRSLTGERRDPARARPTFGGAMQRPGTTFGRRAYD